jgi:hypothetical protein
MNGHRERTHPADSADVYELPSWDVEIPAEWRYTAAATSDTHGGCPLCEGRLRASRAGRHSAPAASAEPHPQKRAAICGECERELFAGLLCQGASRRSA